MRPAIGGLGLNLAKALGFAGQGDYYKALETAILSGVGPKISTIEPVALPLVLCTPQCECIDGVHCFMNMSFNINNWLDHGVVSMERAELLRLPQLAVATLTPFQYVTICDVSPVEFIKAHIGDAGEVCNMLCVGV